MLQADAKNRQKSLLLVSSSIGFRAPQPVGTRFLPFRLKLFRKGRTPWILDYYPAFCTRLYKTGFTVLDMLIYLDKYDIQLEDFEYAVFQFGTVEGWQRDRLDEGREDASWGLIIDRLLNASRGTKYHKLLSQHKQDVINNNMPKVVFSENLFAALLRDLSTRTKGIGLVTYLLFDPSAYKAYTRDSIGRFNNITKQLHKKIIILSSK